MTETDTGEVPVLRAGQLISPEQAVRTGAEDHDAWVSEPPPWTWLPNYRPCDQSRAMR